ncbi:MAG: hypothetical protein R2708_11285 [Vicinamibacterales bacterium]
MSGDAPPAGPVPQDVHAFCRDVEAFLCRRNGGHLIRIVGPAFDLVKGWAAQGVPLSVVCDGIDRAAERAERKPGRRRPLRIEFCEGDVLDGFDRWRRAVGVLLPGADEDAVAKRSSLTAHVERVTAQLRALLESDRAAGAVRAVLPDVLASLDALGSRSLGARGAARDALIADLAALDRRLVEAAGRGVSDAAREALAAEAARELDAFRGRLDPAQWAAAVDAARLRLMRAAAGLPVVSFE